MRAHGSTEAEIIAYRNGFTTGAMWRQTFAHWISIEDDGNPTASGWYIFTTGNIVDVGYYLGDNEWRDVRPTHWMPKPSVEHLRETTKMIEIKPQKNLDADNVWVRNYISNITCLVNQFKKDFGL